MKCQELMELSSVIIRCFKFVNDSSFLALYIGWRKDLIHYLALCINLWMAWLYRVIGVNNAPYSSCVKKKNKLIMSLWCVFLSPMWRKKKKSEACCDPACLECRKSHMIKTCRIFLVTRIFFILRVSWYVSVGCSGKMSHSKNRKCWKMSSWYKWEV